MDSSSKLDSISCRFCSSFYLCVASIGCVAQLVERRSLTGELSLSCADLQLMGDHLCG